MAPQIPFIAILTSSNAQHYQSLRNEKLHCPAPGQLNNVHSSHCNNANLYILALVQNLKGFEERK
jgi:hypothetical protein